ncbi:MAG TPA: hypothetical protein VJ770_28320 [Stellaceae bacterium]|nr:hypothetical protein [Stellaceae bacterium]
MTELFLKYLSWPVAVIFISLVLVLVFRKPLSELVRRGGLKITKEGLSIDQAAVAAVSVQSEATPIVSTLKLDPETERQVSELKQMDVPVIIREQKLRIRKDLEKLSLLNNKDETIDILIQHLAIQQLLYAVERTYRIIFGSQIAILNHLNVNDPTTERIIQVFYEEAETKFPKAYENYSFDAYLSFLINSNLLIKTNNVTYMITPLGKEFLQWMVAQGIPDVKPFLSIFIERGERGFDLFHARE